MNADFLANAHPAARKIVLIPAAGVGARMGANQPKQYLMIGNRSILQHTAEVFLRFAAIDHVCVVVSPDDAYVDQMLASDPRLTVLRCGGETRRDSVRNGLVNIASKLNANDWILVHDAARPGLTHRLLTKLLRDIGDHPTGGILAMPVVDTVKRVADGKVRTIPREGLWLAQTPQMFRYQLLCDALDRCDTVTDEASAVEALGYAPLMVEGHLCNLKVTHPEDLLLMKQFIENRKLFDEK